jgi:hypothetical protein
MEILLKETQEIITDTQFRLMYPNTSFPQVLTADILDAFDAVAIMEGPHAVATSVYEFNQRTGIQEINGQWFTKYELGPIFTDTDDKTAEEQLNEYKTYIDNQAAVQVRNQRNQLLKDSDWTQVLDAPVDKAEWATYRQALRDISLQETFPHNIIWPTQP